MLGKSRNRWLKLERTPTLFSKLDRHQVRVQIYREISSFWFDQLSSHECHGYPLRQQKFWSHEPTPWPLKIHHKILRKSQCVWRQQLADFPAKFQQHEYLDTRKLPMVR